MTRRTRFDYKGKFALVTGASKGLGKAYAEELAARGSNLVLVARSKAELETLAVALRRDYKVRAEVIQADLGDMSAPSTIAEGLERIGIQPDLLLNNAAVGYSGRFFSRPLGEELIPVVVNVQSLVELTHVLGKKMVARGSGGIINIGSNGGFQPVPYNATYSATKAFVLLFSEAVAEELKGSGVRMMIANPGPTATEFFVQSPTSIKLEKMDSAQSVARRTLDDFSRGKVVSYPGRLSTRVSTWISRILPRGLTTALVAHVSRSMGFDR
ncbi:SDR family oxidoreductase [Granulicella sp. WH15]|uniref:SDR family NAD(P)-dependent oxidoreductase n=1 Tax=Granulicella sp. WH15 TaxID=2602070 RepID=UPI00136795F7|nr:SDR family oxidoreductase [Granulicella sp. WH15]QHN03032.1 SDR family oxidoreductase [Granulicella sp. WH15]